MTQPINERLFDNSLVVATNEQNIALGSAAMLGINAGIAPAHQVYADGQPFDIESGNTRVEWSPVTRNGVDERYAVSYIHQARIKLGVLKAQRNVKEAEQLERDIDMFIGQYRGTHNVA